MLVALSPQGVTLYNFVQLDILRPTSRPTAVYRVLLSFQQKLLFLLTDIKYGD